ncbi:MAG: SpoIIE family protein phosphatase [Candidatus Aenigmarchaeota archaeon]|nr:SpoIIE family protein phosphatase [Candidatus Aenigmarchaeota archaeon]
MRLISFGKTEKGEDHLENEDAILIDNKKRFYAVADGVSLPYGGKEAAERAIKYLKSCFKSDLKKAINFTNKKICEDKLKNPTIGHTTLTAVLIQEKTLKIGHVGDSYAFIVRKNRIKEITMPDGIRGTGILTQAIGQSSIEVHSYEKSLQKGDYIIISSDGIIDILKNKEILNIVKKYKKSKDIVNSLIKETKKKLSPYKDDLSVIVILLK